MTQREEARVLATDHRRTPMGRRRSENGAAAVELVIILPLCLAFILGTIALGAAYFQQLNLTEAAREGARTGATLRVGLDVPNFSAGYPLNPWFEEVAAATASTAADWDDLCITYAGPYALTPTGSSIVRAARQINGGGLTYSSTPCFVDDRPAGERRVQVAINGTGPFDNFFTFRRTLNLQGTALAQYERPYVPTEAAGL
jgi:hypothetical protein